MYYIVKHIHITLVIISLTLFQFRFWRYHVLHHQPMLLLQRLPHVIDSLLLVSGIGLAVMAGFSPLNSPWLLFKLAALVIYIVAGMLAMKQSGHVKWLFYLMASIAVLYIIFAATQKIPWPQ